MLIGYTPAKVSETDAVLTKLYDATHEFYLTGSRFFGHAKPDSDWDFFVKDSAVIRSYLDILGFKPLYITPYTDVEIISVYRHSSARIDVQVVRDVYTKAHVQQMLNSRYEWKYFLLALPRETRSVIWDFAYCALKGIANNPRRLDPATPVLSTQKLVWC